MTRKTNSIYTTKERVEWMTKRIKWRNDLLCKAVRSAVPKLKSKLTQWWLSTCSDPPDVHKAMSVIIGSKRDKSAFIWDKNGSEKEGINKKGRSCGVYLFRETTIYVCNGTVCVLSVYINKQLINHYGTFISKLKINKY